MFDKPNSKIQTLVSATLMLAVAMLGLDHTARLSLASPSLAQPAVTTDPLLDLPPVYGMCQLPEEGAGDCSACTGIQPLTLRLSAGGYMLDFRYRIEDPTVAETWLEHMPPPYIEIPENGHRLMVPSSPKVGPLRQQQRPGTPSRVGAVRFAMFANPGQRVQPGQWVRIHFGEHRGWLVVQ